MTGFIVGCLLAASIANSLSSSVLVPFGKSHGDRRTEARDQPVVVSFPEPLRFQCRDFSVAVVDQSGLVALDDSLSSPLLSRFFPEKAEHLIRLVSTSKYRLYYRSTETQRDRSRVTRIIRAAVRDLDFDARWSAIFTFQRADRRGKLSRDQREAAASQIVLTGDEHRSFVIVNFGNRSSTARVLFRGPRGSENANTRGDYSNVDLEGRWLYSVSCGGSVRSPSATSEFGSEDCCNEAADVSSISLWNTLVGDVTHDYKAVATLPDIPVPPKEESCNFETKRCPFWQQSLHDNTDWMLNSGPTPSHKTGPQTGNDGSKAYMYLEASAVHPGEKAVLESRPFPATDPLSLCQLSFAYHMSSTPELNGMGTLIVKILGLKSKRERTVWERSGDQGNTWRTADVLLSSTEPFQVLLVGVRGPHYNSDMAIDDVMYSTYCRYRTCHMEGVVYLHGYKWSSPDGCKSCVCNDGTRYCTTVQCNHPKECIKYADPSPGKCCPECLSVQKGVLGLLTSAGCPSGDTTHAHRSRWTQDGCLECECLDGTTSCTRLPACSQSAESVVSLAGCSFEEGLCDWTNDASGEVEWTRQQGATPTSGTGPTVDHTLGTEMGYYVYMESSQPTRPDHQAILVGPMIDSQDAVYGIQFWYHMYGEHTGTLTVSVRLLSGVTREVWSAEGDKGDQWLSANIPLTSIEARSYRVVFTATRASGYLGDIGLDDITWIFSPVSEVPTVMPTEDPDIDMSVCDFEQDFCQWKTALSDGVEAVWNRHQGGTPTRETGPSIDHTLGTENGYYIFFESSNPTRRGHRARLEGQAVHAGVSVCGIRFWYHMYGASMSTLTVTLEPFERGGAIELWEESSDHGDQWLEADIDFPAVEANTLFSVVFSATRTSNYLGDIGLDDIQYVSCFPTTTKVTEISTSTPTEVVSPTTEQVVVVDPTSTPIIITVDPSPTCRMPCQNGGTCDGKNRCTCPAEFRGRYCQKSICSQLCQNRGVCIGVNQCDCASGYEGKYCQNDINECINPGCHQNARCINTPGSYDCVCSDGFVGDGFTCASACSQPCQNNGACNASGLCSCRQGFDGSFCENDIDECALGLNACDPLATCVNTRGSYRCDCPQGYNLHDDGSSCIDVDECNGERAESVCATGAECVNNDGSYTCECRSPRYWNQDQTACNEDEDECALGSHDCSPFGVCTNTIGSFSCDCNTGFIGDGKTCIRVTEPPPTVFTGRLLYTDRRSVRACYLHLPMNESSSTLYSASAEQSALYLDYDLLSSTIYWTDMMGHAIHSGGLLGRRSASVVVTDELLGPEGIAVDWVGRNLYITDAVMKAIKVMSLDGTKVRLLFFHRVGNPRAIVVDPARGYFYWTDWKLARATITKATMDGTQSRVIVAGNLRFPNGLAIDYANAHLYWADSGIGRIERSDLNGQGREQVRRLPQSHHPFGLDVLDGYVYYSHGRQPGAIYRVSKDEGPTPVCRTKPKITSVKAIDARQANVANTCSQCSSDSLCLMSTSGSRCVCPTDVSGNPLSCGGSRR